MPFQIHFIVRLVVFKYDLTNPLEKSLFERKKARLNNDYPAFINQFYKDFEEQLTELQLQSSQYHTLSEDQITTIIVSNLKSMGYNANHDANSNGHVDINIKDGSFNWFGECKLQKGDEYTFGGFLQLTTRYSRSLDNAYHGGIVVYHQNTTKKALISLQSWKERVAQEKDLDITCQDIPPYKLYFDSKHIHATTGHPYHIRHFWVNLTYNPKA